MMMHNDEEYLRNRQLQKSPNLAGPVVADELPLLFAASQLQHGRVRFPLATLIVVV